MERIPLQSLPSPPVPNFRVALRNKAGFPAVYRSSKMDALSRTQMQQVVDKYRIRTMVDLRSPNEAKGSPHSGLNQLFTPVRIDPYKDSAEAYKASGSQPRRRFMVSLFGKNAFKALVAMLPNFFYRIFVYILAIFDRIVGSTYLQKFIGPRILNPLGPLGLNQKLIDHSQLEIGAAIRVFAQNTKETYPIMVNCSQGKDRTGLVVALVQSLTASDGTFSEEDCSLFAQHYSMSYDNLKPYPNLLSEITKKYHMKEEFAWSNKETMIDTLQYVKDGYNSVQEYLKKCGLTDSELEAIKSNIEEYKEEEAKPEDVVIGVADADADITLVDEEKEPKEDVPLLQASSSAPKASADVEITLNGVDSVAETDLIKSDDKTQLSDELNEADKTSKNGEVETVEETAVLVEKDGDGPEGDVLEVKVKEGGRDGEKEQPIADLPEGESLA